MSAGFYWTANSPYIQKQWLRVRRAPRAPGISTTITDGFIDIMVSGRTHRLANPAFLIYECLTNPEWGMGGPQAQIDTDNFAAVAQLYRDEGFGLFMLWVQSDTIENFIGEVLDHVQTFLFLSPVTGLWTLAPLRADYDVDTLPVYTPDNASFDDFDRKLPGETINEIVVTWTNPVTEQAETVTMQDLASIVQQGGQIVSQSRDYYGVRTSELALRLAARDIRSACAPLASCTMRANRQAWSTTPGQCIKVTVPSEGADEIIMRVQGVDYGDRSDAYVKVSLLEDIFALDAPVYTGAANTGWQNPASQPTSPSRVKLFTAPYALTPSDQGVITLEQDVEVYAGLLIADANPDFQSVEPYSTSTLASGEVVQESIGTFPRTGFCLSNAVLLAESTSDISLLGLQGVGPLIGGLAFIGEGSDSTTEVALVQAVAPDGTVTLARGVLDTVPRAWPTSTPIWFLNTKPSVDPEPRAPGETVSYRPLMRTSLGLLAYASGEDRVVTLTDRPYKPLRPANVKVNGQGFGVVNVTGDATVTWANRNRLTETSRILPWTIGDVTPEQGQTTTVLALGVGGAVVHVYEGLTGTSYTIPSADLTGITAIRVKAVLNGIDSLQAYALGIT